MAAAVAAIAILAAVYGCKSDPPKPPPPPPPPTTPATTPATTQAAIKPATAPVVKPIGYLDVARAARPALAECEPLIVPVTLKEAARFQLSEPVLLDAQGHLWITRHDGQAGEAAVRQAMDQSENEHVVKERVLYVWWVPDRARDWLPLLIVRRSDGDGAAIVSNSSRHRIGRRSDYRWDRARSWVEGNVQRLAVPTSHGISVFTFAGVRQPPDESHQDLLELREPATTAPATAPGTAPSTVPTSRPAAASSDPPQFLFGLRGLLAWVPPGKGRGSAGAAWYVGGAWKQLTPAAGWPEGIIHLIPLADGTIAQVLAQENRVTFAFTTLDENVAVDAKAIMDLVNQLGDDDADRRDRAYKQLAAFGPGALPVLRKVQQDDVPPEAWARLRRLLKAPAVPLLGGIGVRTENLRLVRRLRDGGVLFYTPDQITLPNPQGDEPFTRMPGWIVARPGRIVEALDPALAEEANPDDLQVEIVSGHWIVSTGKYGPRQFLEPVTFRKLLAKDELEFSHVVGVDRRGRWLFRKPVDAESGGAGEDRIETTLIIDPTLADPTPRLPIWVFDNKEGTKVGWDRENWPAVNDGSLERRLVKEDWAPLEPGDSIHTDPPPRPIAPPPATREASTQPATTQSATQPATRRVAPSPVPAVPALLIDADGTSYFGGVTSLRIVDRFGDETNWSLSAEAAGTEGFNVTLLQTRDKRLFLMNGPEKVVRLKPTPGAAEPLTLEAVLKPNLPTEETPIRIWLDPAGRIIVVYEHKLAVMFPRGYIPAAIRERMVTGDDDD
jgi:hypothetical protein